MPESAGHLRKHWKTLIAAVSFGVLAQPVGATAEIEYGYPDQSIFVPVLNARGQPDSPMTKLAEAVLTRAGIRWRQAPYPAARLFRNLGDGTTAFSILVRSPVVENCCVLSKAPVYATDLNVYSIGEKPPVVQRADLIGKRVITVRGYSYGDLLQFVNDPANKIVNEVADTHKAAFDMLTAGRGDYLIDYASAASEILADAPLARLNQRSLQRLQIHLVLSKSYPDAERTMERFEGIVRSLNVPEVLFGRR